MNHEGQGFDPSGIQPESGFKPIVVGEVQSMPSLAFSVLDSMPDEYLDQQSSNSNARDMSVIMQQQSGDSNQFQNSQPLISSQQFTNRRISINNPQLFGENGSVIIYSYSLNMKQAYMDNVIIFAIKERVKDEYVL